MEGGGAELLGTQAALAALFGACQFRAETRRSAWPDDPASALPLKPGILRLSLALGLGFAFSRLGIAASRFCFGVSPL
jgi:hypothetical protein